VKYKFAKYPVFDRKKDEVIGVIFLEDVLKKIANKSSA